MIKFISGRLNTRINTKVIKSFKELSKDNYLKSEHCYRFRAFSELNLNKSNVYIKKNNNFFQKKEINHFAGNISRKFEPIKKDVINTFIHITKELIYFLPNRTQQKADVGLHQIRITCGDDYVGYPVPEGWHKDGCNYVAIITLNYDNIVGGISRIRKNLINQNDVYNCFLEKNNFLLLNEKSYYHYTDPINVKNKKKSGYRDILVITFKDLNV